MSDLLALGHTEGESIITALVIVKPKSNKMPRHSQNGMLFGVIIDLRPCVTVISAIDSSVQLESGPSNDV